VSGWQPPRHCTVIGAAHRRKGVVCQDASRVATLRGRQGASLQVLLVADGHGGRRYSRSDVGSRLACDQALAAVAAALEHTPLDDRSAWLALLCQGLPITIQERWGDAVQAHWQQQPAETPFDLSLYGTTLGVLLLAPDWWGCTGLGDWDLAQVGAAGPALVSEEVLPASAGEATASLCQPDAARLWPSRARLEPLPAAGPPFSLVLSTDGVRKSCATDADFLELCSQIAAVQNAEELGQGLADITTRGSGDDLSVAIGHWAGPGSGSQTAPGAPTAQVAPVAQAPPTAQAPRAARTAVRPSAPPQAGVHPALWIGLGLALAAAAWMHGPPLARQATSAWTTARNTAQIRHQAEQLCRSPAWITPTLNQRRAQFEQLASGRLEQSRSIAAAGRDPLGALIAWSQPPHRNTPGPTPTDSEATDPRATDPRATDPRPIVAPPGSCPALQTALEQQWAQLPPHPTGSSLPKQPKPDKVPEPQR